MGSGKMEKSPDVHLRQSLRNFWKSQNWKREKMKILN
jgi:hypothetical protein